MINLVSILFFQFFLSTTYAGHDVGNGGDLIKCAAGITNDFAGTLSLDYVLTYQKDSDEPIQSFEKSLNRIESILKAKTPELYFKFRMYRNHLFNQVDLAAPYLWISVPNGLVNVTDEQIVSAEAIPANCRSGNSIPLIQAIIRQNSPGPNSTIIFKYMSQAINELIQNQPLQASYLVVHEWLWGLTSDVKIVRLLNHYLHSKKFSDLGDNSFPQILENFGISTQFVLPNLFGGQLCKASSPTAGSDLKSKLFHASYLDKLGPFYARAMKRNCFGTCGPWVESDLLSSSLGLEKKTLAVQTSNYGLALAGFDNSFHGFHYLSCFISDEGRMTCGPLRAPSDDLYSCHKLNKEYDCVDFSGYTDGVCGHLTAFEKQDTDAGRVEWKYSFFFLLDLP